ncbi:hypothetical protein SAY87_012103 [Trapa incisa]|uniref:glycerophosphodiester phosphodiesterase n=1 Tax=Trapa incisa TaxID=236973 RepID=A0AAN7JBX5_9MYRT|nr:hypothetical protein SAY87_012103 [Trapa incisa]
MRNSSFAVFLELLLLSSVMALASAWEPTKWLTLSGNAPLVIARGGFSGLFPDSSYYAYSFALTVSVPDVVMWCDVQLTKDGVGICSPYLTLQNSTNIGDTFSNKENSYVVNGVTTKGWFSIDFTLNDLANVYCKSETLGGILSSSFIFYPT